ncbi:conserved protein of unknown function [Ectopseudomonas oleovorans]|uniref:Uncharacterized protein n=1 Tax=Ectopseudomonas oleovorans TaxID=301 RepID=A0A653B7U9_ECTOL|nr:conserved protein of unknown function [Pseudomonas oleovorans]
MAMAQWVGNGWRVRPSYPAHFSTESVESSHLKSDGFDTVIAKNKSDPAPIGAGSELILVSLTEAVGRILRESEALDSSLRSARRICVRGCAEFCVTGVGVTAVAAGLRS